MFKASSLAAKIANINFRMMVLELLFMMINLIPCATCHCLLLVEPTSLANVLQVDINSTKIK